jgi:hypothetical protein
MVLLLQTARLPILVKLNWSNKISRFSLPISTVKEKRSRLSRDRFLLILSLVFEETIRDAHGRTATLTVFKL